MNRTHLYAGAARWALLVALAAAPLVGCKPAASPDAAPSDAIPLASGAAPALAAAPAASALPAAPPIAVGRLADPGDRYAFADRAYAMNNAFADAPPDYGFDYDGTQPWVWRSNDGAMRVAEVLPGGGDRYYYYQPGADYPYLVRDPEYSYGYDNGELVVIYDRYGRPLPDDQFDARRDYASRFFYRGRTLYSTAQQQRQAVAQDNWVARRRAYEAELSSWASDQQNDADWRAYHQAHQDQYQTQWAAERARRANEGAQFDITINDTQAADRDRQIAQQAQAHAGPPPGPSLLGFHLGGGGTPPPKPAPPLASAGSAGFAPAPSAPAAPAAGAAAPAGPGDMGHHHDRTPAGPTAPTGPAGAPTTPPHHDAAPTVPTQPKPSQQTYPGQLPGLHGGAVPPAGMVRPSPAMQPMTHAPGEEPKAALVKPVEPKQVVVKPVEPKPAVVKPVEPAVLDHKGAPPKPAVVKPAPGDPVPPKHRPRDPDAPDKP